MNDVNELSWVGLGDEIRSCKIDAFESGMSDREVLCALLRIIDCAVAAVRMLANDAIFI